MSIKTMHDRIYTRAALVADALSLGPHWIYNQDKLARIFPGGLTKLHPPTSNYHDNKQAGALTHYGDQLHWLAMSTEAAKGYSADAWRSFWIEQMSQYTGYQDGASKETLASRGRKASASHDLGGASRIAPILDLSISLEEKIAAARDQTAFTHGDPEVADSAEFFVRAAAEVTSGKSFQQALELAATKGAYTALDAAACLDTAKNADAKDFLKAGTDIGLACSNSEALTLALYFAIHHDESFAEAMSKNGLAGGDTSARAMLLALLFAARDGDVGAKFYDQLTLDAPGIDKPQQPKAGSNPVALASPHGQLSGVLEMPEGEIQAFAIFAHCFTCGKDFVPEARIAQELATHGIATLRIDFAGIGKSTGGFEETSFLTNLDDLSVAAEWLTEHFEAPRMLVGHSLGGAAIYAAAAKMPSVKAMVSIGAPFEPANVLRLFESYLPEIEEKGAADVTLVGRKFRISKKFIDDFKKHDQVALLGKLKGHKLVMHAPGDDTVALANAGDIFTHLKHPKSFISLAGADHLLTKKEDSEYVANLVTAWARNALKED